MINDDSSYSNMILNGIPLKLHYIFKFFILQFYLIYLYIGNMFTVKVTTIYF